ncbi:MAG: sulfite reductase subunit C [Proteocatella sp.]
MSINRKILIKNAYRITKVRDKTALRIRVPGGHLESKYFSIIQEIAELYGNGTVHITTRQGFEIPEISFNDIDEINKKIKPLLESLNLSIEPDEKGYPAAGTRNVSACIGDKVCPFANDNTTRIAKRIEREVFPHDFHFKIAVTGCPNDCIKAHMQDFGIICTTEPQYDASRCISCEACVKNCKKRVTGALEVEQYNIKRDADKCIGCGECILKCPTGAWTRSEKPYYRLVIMGRTGKKNPRIAMPFLKWASEDVVVQVIKNTYTYVERYIDKTLAKEHVGYIVDRTGYQVFKNEVLEGIELNKEIQIAQNINWGGYFYNNDNEYIK